jgi:hypothetical protein
MNSQGSVLVLDWKNVGYAAPLVLIDGTYLQANIIWNHEMKCLNWENHG